MTELAILSVSSAGVTITVAIAIFILGRRAADAERRAGDERVRATSAEGKLLSATTSADQWKAKAIDLEKTNAALSDLLAEAASNLDPASARPKLHAKWFAIHHPAAVSTADRPAVPVSAESDTPGPDDLLKPGE